MSQRKFESLTQAGQRVRIAKDVIRQLSLGKIKPLEGTYLWLDGLKIEDVENKSARDVLSDIRCEACALGSLFVSSVLMKNGLRASDAFEEDRLYNRKTSAYEDVVTCDTSVMRERLSDYFDDEQLELIESAFEVADMGSSGYEDEEVEAAMDFGDRFSSPTDRMKAIMQNIIDHRGTFVP